MSSPPPRPDELPKPVRVDATGRLRLWPIALGAVAVAFAFGIVAGDRLGLSKTSQAIASLPASSLVAPGPTTDPTAVADVQPGAVSPRLRAAYDASGGAIAVCAIAASVRCQPEAMAPTNRSFPDITTRFSDVDWSKLRAVDVAAARIVVVGDFGLSQAAVLLPLDTRAARILTVVDPDGVGIDYLDLGDLGPGRYVVTVSVPAWSAPAGILGFTVGS